MQQSQPSDEVAVEAVSEDQPEQTDCEKLLAALEAYKLSLRSTTEKIRSRWRDETN